jgi:DNA-binding LacI/PurR family transcriptional regulator
MVITIHDVARAAGVGVGTASRALSGKAHVTDATRAHVMAVAGRLGFHPSPIARAFSRGRSQTIEIIMPLFTRHFYVEVLRGIEEAIGTTDYSLLVRTIERNTDRDRLVKRPRMRGRVDGALLVSLRPTRGMLERFAEADVAVVLVDVEHPRLSSVAVDHEAAAKLAIRHLLELGHRRIALIDHPEDPFMPVYPDSRHRGYRSALAEAGLEARSQYERVTDYSPEAGAAAMDELLRLKEPPTAVFAGSDSQALGVLDVARQHGVSVPEDLAVVGYNDVEIAPYLGLTTVQIPMRELGRRGIELLLRTLEDPQAPVEHVRLPARLVVRRTTGAPAAEGARASSSRKGRLTAPPDKAIANRPMHRGVRS